MSPHTSEQGSHQAFDGIIAPPDTAPVDAAHDVEEAVERAQDAANNVAATVSEHAGDTRTLRPASLDAMDAAIADGADEVIESVFASVEDLLGDSLHAADEEESVAAAEGNVSSAEQAAEETPQADAEEIAKSEPDDLGAVKADEVNEAVDHDEPKDSAVVTAEPNAASQPAEPVEEEGKGGEKSTRKFAMSILTWLGRAVRSIRWRHAATAVLSAMAYPLRLAPEWARPYVDWFALSLVFWIPVVWVFAVFIVGR